MAMTEDKASKKDNSSQFTDAQTEKLRKFTQSRLLSQAPPPITPLSTLSLTSTSKKVLPATVSGPEKQKPNSSTLWTISADDLMAKWGVDESIIEQLILEHGFPVYDSIFRESFNIGTPKDWLKYRVQEGPFNRFKFRPCDVEQMEEQKPDFLNSKTEQIGYSSTKKNGKTKEPLDMDAYIEKRRTEGIKDEIIAVELHDEKGNFKLSYLETARELGFDKNLNATQIDAIKHRGMRACNKGKALLQKQ
jgi:hypothetical protein